MTAQQERFATACKLVAEINNADTMAMDAVLEYAERICALTSRKRSEKKKPTGRRVKGEPIDDGIRILSATPAEELVRQ